MRVVRRRMFMNPRSIAVSGRHRGAVCFEITSEQAAGITADVRHLETVCMVSRLNFASELMS